ncbi:MAG TPA: tyrosine-type recombinase/integrase [Terracidiphilus sp.]|nr:tyrosine-type recombinase/integrase [Terracidiphilus sp.]
METKRHPVNLKQYRKLNGKWQFVAVARDAQGNPDPRLILLNGHQVSSKGGTFYLDYQENGRRRQTAVGTDARVAREEWRTKLALLKGEIEPDPDEADDAPNASRTIDEAIASFLIEVEATKGTKTFRQYSRELEWFRRHCRKRYVAELDRSDAMRLFVEGRKEIVDGKPLNQKTINRRVIIMLNAMRSQGAAIEMKKGDWPKTIDKKIEIYQPEELKAFFAACDPDERLIFHVFLCTGFREREVATLAWSDIHWKEGKLGVSAKPAHDFTPKSYEERTVPVPMSLIAALRERKKASSSLLVFPTPPHPTRPDYGRGDNPDGHLLELCKEIALRAGVNCGHCKGEYTVYALSKGVLGKVKRTYKCDKSPRCQNWYLHKFRHTFATNILQSVDIRSLQVMLGHKNIATTEKYLKSLRLDQLRERIESSVLAAYV